MMTSRKYLLLFLLLIMQNFLCCEWIVVDNPSQNSQVYLAVGGVRGSIKILDLVERAVV